MEEYDSKVEFCKISKFIPLNLIKMNCKNLDISESMNSSYKMKIFLRLLILLLLLFVMCYFLFINDKTTILKSNINIGVLLTIFIILSMYSTIMTFLEFGRQGPIGEKGVRGSSGDQGVKGNFGPSGFMGKSGSVGLNGNIGPPGIKGPPGNIGIMGPRGLRGPRGIKGKKGFKGKQGIKGINGEPGVNGFSGPKGEKGEDNVLNIIAAKGGDSNIPHPVFTYNSESQNTNWRNIYNFYDIHDDKTNMFKCDTARSREINNSTYNQCKNECTKELDENGYMKCVGIYGDLDLENPDIISGNGKCFICPEVIYTTDYYISKLKDISGKKSANSVNPNMPWENFVTGIKLKTVRNDDEIDSGHAYLTNFYVKNK